MIRIRRAAVVFRMAAVTIGWQRSVVIVHVAAGAGHRRMRPGQRKTGVVVIETCLGPGRCVVANVTLLREADRDVVRIRRVCEIGQMAGHACRIGQFVIAVRMALAALQ